MNFTRDWFSHNIPVWERIIKPHLATIERPRVLEIGAYEGLATLWFLRQSITLEITVVDCWPDSEVFERFFDNCFDFRNRIRMEHDRSQVALRRLLPGFDVVYVDGDHTATVVLHDAVLSFELLKEGGLLVFDDYRGGAGVLRAVDAFASCNGGAILIHDGYQRIYRKVL